MVARGPTSVPYLPEPHPPVTGLDISVPGEPAPQGSKAFKGFAGDGHAILAESSAAVAPWRAVVRLVAKDAMRGRPLLAGQVAVHASFVLTRPRSAPKTRRGRAPSAAKRPDVDKLVRAVLDGLTGVVFSDDAQVTVLRADKRVADLGEGPRADVSVWELD